MPIRLASLGSGSKGNGTLVEQGDTCILVDCGFSIRETERRLARLDRTPEQLTAILVTHEHSDHLRGVFPLAKKYSVPVMMTAGTIHACGDRIATGVEPICTHSRVKVGSMVVTPVAVPHDAREPVQFIFDTPGCRVGVLTDLGTITPHVVENYKECDGLLLEANHDVQMLAQGIYPPSLKRRVGGAYGHLSNHQSCSLLQQVNRQRLQTLVLGHISLQNNHKNLVAGAVADFEDELNTVIYADQEQGLDWQVIENHA